MHSYSDVLADIQSLTFTRIEIVVNATFSEETKKCSDKNAIVCGKNAFLLLFVDDLWHNIEYTHIFEPTPAQARILNHLM